MSTAAGDVGGSPPQLEVIRDRLTPERLSSYLVDSGGDLAAALHLYEWNMRAAAAVVTTTGMVEVIVRNRIDQVLAAAPAFTGQSWFDHLTLDGQGRVDLEKARARATKRGRRHAVYGSVIAELTFGFWRYLVASLYLTSLWVPMLHEAFPNGHPDLRLRRAAVEQHLQSLLFVRNRAAHHEPIHRRDLAKDLAAAEEILEWTCPDSRAWAMSASPLAAVINARPD